MSKKTLKYLHSQMALTLGGLNIQNVSAYLQSSLIAAVGGSWIAKRSLIQVENWDTIIQNAQEIRNLLIDHS